MAKLPKLSELTDVQGMLTKVKSAIESITGPVGSSTAASDAIQEGDPLRTKMVELELLMTQLKDIQFIQARTINALQSKYNDIRKMVDPILAAKAVKAEENNTSSTEKTTVSENAKENKTEE